MPGAFRLRRRSFAPHASTPRHEHDCAYFCLIARGDGRQHSGGIARTRACGEVFFYPAGESQSETFGADGGAVFAVDFSARVDGLPPRSHEVDGAAALLVRRLALLQADDVLDVDELATLAASALARMRRDAMPWLEAAREYIHAHFASPLTLDEIAATANVHPVHLCRTFPRRFGTTIGSYVRALRLDVAARQLATTARPIAEIALDAGFSSQAHLTRHFTAQMRVSPALYRAWVGR
ncbi:MAG: helix-turn-helix transcriptional regulator [Acidobacteria bacterium]|nr:helix-turn-helix transcriptional regulator [Acidobacteriota bacterium]MBV9476226.1 helix-turn-helix transcriptional regulator [Acidobacteriota bacterium]